LNLGGEKTLMHDLRKKSFPMDGKKTLLVAGKPLRDRTVKGIIDCERLSSPRGLLFRWRGMGRQAYEKKARSENGKKGVWKKNHRLRKGKRKFSGGGREAEGLGGKNGYLCLGRGAGKNRKNKKMKRGDAERKKNDPKG